MRVVAGVVFVFFLGGFVGCGAVQPPPPVQAAEPAPPPPPADLSGQGVPVSLGELVDIHGYKTVWVQGTQLLITLSATAWDEMSVGEETVREGRATLTCRMDDNEERITIGENRSKTAFGYAIRVEYAFEHYNESTGAYSPHVKFKVTQP